MNDSDFDTRVREEILNSHYFNDIKYNIRSKSRLKFLSDISQIFSYIFTSISIILTFATGYFDNLYLSFAAGCLGTIGLVLLKISSYFMAESKERTKQVNILLQHRNFPSIPDIAIDNI